MALATLRESFARIMTSLLGVSMKTIFLLLSLFLSLHSFSKSVFLVEDEHGKHIGLSSDNKSCKLITSGTEWHLYPSITKDAKVIAYAKGSGPTDLRLVVKNLQTGKTLALTKPGFVLQPMFSKNGKRIFASIKESGVNKLFYIDYLKNKKLNYITSMYPSFFPAPFQDGERVVYQKNISTTKKEIVLLDLITKKEEVIGQGMSPTLSPDERFIAYTSKENRNWDIKVYDRFKKTTVKVTTNPANDFSPSFDAENNLFFTSDRNENGVYSIYSKSLKAWTQNSGDDKLRISKKGISFYAPKFSGEAKYILTSMPEMTGESKSSFGTINHNGRIYTVGGHQGPEHTYPPESFSNRVSTYDIATNKWIELAPKINKAHGLQLAAFGNYIYAFGGFAYEESTSPKWKSIDVVERYNIKKDLWEEIGSMPRNRSSNALAQIGNKVYLFGGWDATPKFENDIDGTFHNEIDVYDISLNTWTTLSTKLPVKRRAFSSFVKDQMIYLVGGISEGGSQFSLSDAFTKFDPKNNQFSEMPKLPFGTFAPATGAIGNEGFMFGGMFKLGKFDYEYVPHIYKYDFKRGRWIHTGRYMSENKGFSQVLNIGNKCLGILGGHSYASGVDKPVNTFEKICL